MFQPLCLLQVDFGCGSGSLLESLLEVPTSLQTIVGVDISQKALDRAAKVCALLHTHTPPCFVPLGEHNLMSLMQSNNLIFVSSKMHLHKSWAV